MQIVHLNNFIHNFYHFLRLFAHSEKLWARMLCSPEPSASRSAISAAVTRSLAACEGDDAQWWPELPWAPAPSPACVPTLPPPPAAAFTPGGEWPEGRDPGPGAHLSCARPYVRSLQTRLRHFALRSRRHELLWDNQNTDIISPEWDHTAYQVARTRSTDFPSFYGGL